MASLAFYDGVNCIGGNKILLEADGTSLFLDFSLNFGAEGRYFDEFLNPGAYAIETSEGWVVHTGDLRLHGRKAPKTRAFMQEAAALDCYRCIRRTRAFSGRIWRENPGWYFRRSARG